MSYPKPIGYYTTPDDKPLLFHLIDVGEGLMVLLVFPDQTTMLCDCNVTGDPWVLFEFERFETGDENKIRSKAENLALAWHQSQGTVELCVFIYWLRSSRAPKSIDGLRGIFQAGSRRDGKVLPAPGGRHAIVKAVACQSTGRAVDGTVTPRVVAGEDRQLMVLQTMQPLVGIG